jgi:hypothetical protein
MENGHEAYGIIGYCEQSGVMDHSVETIGEPHPKRPSYYD